MKVGKLKEILKDLSDDVEILYQDPFSEFSYNSFIEVYKGFSHIDHTANDGYKFYCTWIEEGFEDFINDNPDEEEGIRKVYKPVLVIGLKEE